MVNGRQPSIKQMAKMPDTTVDQLLHGSAIEVDGKLFYLSIDKMAKTVSDEMGYYMAPGAYIYHKTSGWPNRSHCQGWGEFYRKHATDVREHMWKRIKAARINVPPTSAHR